MALGRRHGMSEGCAVEALRSVSFGVCPRCGSRSALGHMCGYAASMDVCCKVCSEADPCDCADGGVFEGSWDANGAPVEAPC